MKRFQQDKVLLIIPAYNEAKSILNTCRSITNYNEKYGTNYDFIVINDGSTDTTDKILAENNLPHINLIYNLGIGGAVQTGYKYAQQNNYDFAIQFDDDGQHDVRSVKDLLQPLRKDKADLVIGSRFVDKRTNNFKSTAARRAGIKLISTCIYIITGQRVLDTTSGFRACNRTVIDLFATSYPTEYPEPVTDAEIIRRGLRLTEVSARMNERQEGSSSIRSWKNFYYMINVCLSLAAVKIKRSWK